jgi:hypothetical protein
MAYIAQDQDDNNFNQSNQNTQSSTAPQPTEPQSNSPSPSPQPTNSTGGGGSSAATKSPTAPSAPKPVNVDTGGTQSSSGNFTNLQNYIKANQNYNGGQGLAGQTYDKLNSQAQGVQSNIDQSQQQFQQQANQNERAYDPNVINQASTNSAAYAANPNNVSTFQNNYLNAKYNGPTSIANAQDLTSQAQNLKNTTDLVGTEPGRYALLQNLYGNSNYSTGQQQLDNLLLQGNSQQLAKLQSAQNLGTNVNTNLTNDLTNASNLAQQYTTEAANTAAQTKNAMNSAITGYQSDLDARTAALNAQRQQQYNTAQQELTSGQVTQDLLNQTGLKNNQDIFGLQLQNYLNQAPETATKNNVATDADQARFNALSQLMSDQTLNNYVTPQQIANAVQIDQTGLLAGLKGARAAALAPGTLNVGNMGEDFRGTDNPLTNSNFVYGSSDPTQFVPITTQQRTLFNNPTDEMAYFNTMGTDANPIVTNSEFNERTPENLQQVSDFVNWNKGFETYDPGISQAITNYAGGQAALDNLLRTIQVMKQPPTVNSGATQATDTSNV